MEEINYKKKYEEALEQAKKELAVCGSMDCDAARLIFRLFTQLSESDDERIINALILELKTNPSIARTNGYNRTDYITWLEKQKENPKTADSISSDCTADAKCEDRSPKHSDSDGTDIRDTPAYWRGWDDAMKQKEQKQIKWTDLTWKDIVELEGIIYNVHYDFSAGIGQESFGKEVLERFRSKKDDAEVDACEQKSVEWSATDNIGWDEAFACVTRAEKAAKNEEELQNAVTAEKWLKEIKFKYYIHPVKQEWSEEDEKMVNNILYVLGQYIDYKAVSGTGTGYATPRYGKEIDWLKSLKNRGNFPKSNTNSPSWKPSEEQMDALAYAIQLLDDGLSPKAAKAGEELEHFREQLKKL